MRHPLACILAWCVVATITAAEPTSPDLPLGVVRAVDAAQVQIEFLAEHDVGVDSVLALYGPGRLEKHPLTQKVIAEHRSLDARAMVTAVDGAVLGARIYWTREGATIAPGHDAVPVPGEASPDTPPALLGEPPTVTVPIQGRVELRAPLRDPEGRPLSCTWSLPDVAHPGVLEAEHTGDPVVGWLAPAVPGDATVQVIARDPVGQTRSVELSITVTGLPDGWRSRALVSQRRMGAGVGRPLVWLGRNRSGRWWGITERGAVMTYAPGWRTGHEQPLSDDVRLSGPVAMVPAEAVVYILDARQRSVAVVAHDGVLRSRIGELRSPTDLVRDSAGALYVADQQSGGVLVHDPDGSFRCTLGRPGEGPDRFAGLTRLAMGPDDTCYALDAEQAQVLRYDASHRRIGSWPIQVGEDIELVDIAWHPDGLLVLLDSGKVLIVGADGLATRSIPPLSESGWFERLYAPSSVSVDPAGSVYVTYPDDGLIARHGIGGRLTGVRGPELWAVASCVTDGRGSCHVIDERSGMVSRFDAAGWLTARFGGMRDAGGPFERPGAMAVSPDGRYLCVVDTRRICVVRYDLARLEDRPLIFGQKGENQGQFEEPVGLALDAAGHCYVLDADLHRVVVFDANGSFLFDFGRYDRGREADELQRPARIAVAPDGGTAYIYDSRRYEVMKFALDQSAGSAQHVTNTGGRGRDLGQFYRVVAMGCDRLGLLYVADSSRDDLQALDFRGANGVPLLALDHEQIDLRGIEGMALHPDGYPLVFGDGTAVGLRWE
ncbi:MAG: NHL repeat-containing protein [Planctomycetota bacterium]